MIFKGSQGFSEKDLLILPIAGVDNIGTIAVVESTVRSPPCPGIIRREQN